MSVNRENIVWQDANGTWSMGMYEFYSVNQDDDDWDYEWDVEYNYSRFNWVTRQRYATEQQAKAAWDGANPGSHSVQPWAEIAKAEIASFETMREERIKQMGPPRPSYGVFRF